MLRKSVIKLLAPRLSSRLGAQMKKIQRRTYASTVDGPPKYPLTGVEQWILGGGFVVAIMIMPMWGLSSVPRWAAVHKRTDK